LRGDAERLVEALFRATNRDAAAIAAAVWADQSLSEPRRNAALRDVLRRSLAPSEAQPSGSGRARSARSVCHCLAENRWQLDRIVPSCWNLAHVRRNKTESPRLGAYPANVGSNLQPGVGMSVQTVTVTPTIEWDDSVVFIFSFTGADSSKTFCGFVHQQIQLSSVTGSQTQVTSILQVIQQQGIQVSTDPQTWIEAIKNAARNTNNQITVTYDDIINVPYTTQTNLSFQLQQLYRVTG
jgi:hypothetical protein